MRGVLRRLTWGLADQAVTSLVSFVVGIVVARELGALEFGAFSLAWVTYGVVVNISRGLGTDPLAVRFSGVERPLWRTAVASSSGMAIAVGLILGAACAAVGALLGGHTGAGFIALGIVLPGLMLQDSWRFAFFTSGQGGKAFVSDITWALALVPLLYLASQDASVTRFVLAWGGAGAFAALVSGLQAGIMPRVSRALHWFRDHRDLSVRYLTENLTISGAYQLRMYGLGAFAGRRRGRHGPRRRDVARTVLHRAVRCRPGRGAGGGAGAAAIGPGFADLLPGARRRAVRRGAGLGAGTAGRLAGRLGARTAR